MTHFDAVAYLDALSERSAAELLDSTIASMRARAAEYTRPRRRSMARLKQIKLDDPGQSDFSIDAQIAELLPLTLAGQYDQRALRKAVDRMWLTVEALLAKSAELLKTRESAVGVAVRATEGDAASARRDEMLEVLSVKSAATELKDLSNMLEMGVRIEALYEVLAARNRKPRPSPAGGNG